MKRMLGIAIPGVRVSIFGIQAGFLAFGSPVQAKTLTSDDLGDRKR